MKFRRIHEFAGRFALALGAVLALAPAPGQAAQPYPNTEQFGGTVDQGAPWFARCLEVRDLRPPEGEARPRGTGRDCDAMEAYYAAKDDPQSDADAWRKVRGCALASGDRGVLMMLSANGLGGKRDLRLALREACALGGAPAELMGRVEHLVRLMADEARGGKVSEMDVCDDITSGYMQGVCTALESRRAEARRDARFGGIERSLDPAQRPAWDRLMKAVAAFAEARGGEETDMSGTARAALALQAQDAELELCLKDAERFEKGELPSQGAPRLAELDAALNAAYRAVQGAKSDSGRLGFSTVTKEGVKATQRAWLKYRDAWVAFGRARHPSVEAQAWQALLTKRRLEQLRELHRLARASQD